MAPSATWASEMPSLALRAAWFKPRIWLVNRSEIARPAASSLALLMRRPDERRWMDSEIETHHQEAHAPVAALARLAGALPAFGIIAAVLGVVNTMGSVGQPPSVLGGMIGSALVGTFLGILLAYGVVEPLGGLVEQKTEDAAKELQCIKSTLLASMQGYNPATAIEFGRKVLFSGDRPSFLELESHVKGKK